MNLTRFNTLMVAMGGGGVTPIADPFDSRLGTLYRYHDTNVSTSLWQDSARSTQITANNQTCGAWDDLSGNGRHFTQATGGFRPLYKATAYGSPALQSDEIDDWLQHAVAIGNSYQIYVIGYAEHGAFPGLNNKVDPWLTSGVGGSGLAIESYNSFGTRNELRFYAEFCTTPTWDNGANYTYPASITPQIRHVFSAVNANTTTSNVATRVMAFTDTTHLSSDPLYGVLMYTAPHNATQLALVHQWALARFTGP